MAQDIPDISSGRADFLIVPVPHPAALDQNAWDSLRSSIVIRATGGHIGSYHIWNIDLFCHFSGYFYSFLWSCPGIINIRCQLLIIVSAVKINIIICCWLQFLRYCPGKPLHLCSFRISRKFTVEVSSVSQSHTSVTVFKRRTVHNLYDDDRAGHLFDLKLLGQFDCRLNSHIFSGMYSGSDKHGLSLGMSMQDRCRKSDFSVCKLQFPVPFLSRFYGYVFEMKSSSLSSSQQKNRRSTVVDDLFFCPDLFPDRLITGYIQKSGFCHGFQIPFRTF